MEEGGGGLEGLDAERRKEEEKRWEKSKNNFVRKEEELRKQKKWLENELQRDNDAIRVRKEVVIMRGTVKSRRVLEWKNL